MIKNTSVLSESDWKNLNGNEVYVQMLRNKVVIEISKVNVDAILGSSLEYIKEIETRRKWLKNRKHLTNHSH